MSVVSPEQEPEIDVVERVVYETDVVWPSSDEIVRELQSEDYRLEIVFPPNHPGKPTKFLKDVPVDKLYGTWIYPSKASGYNRLITFLKSGKFLSHGVGASTEIVSVHYPGGEWKYSNGAIELRNLYVTSLLYGYAGERSGQATHWYLLSSSYSCDGFALYGGDSWDPDFFLPIRRAPDHLQIGNSARPNKRMESNG